MSKLNIGRRIRAVVSRTNVALLVIVYVVAVRWPSVLSALRLNQTSVEITRDILVSTSRVSAQSTDIKEASNQSCPSKWLAGRLALTLSISELNQAAWKVAFVCDVLTITMAHNLAPANNVLSDLALQQRPLSAESWFWKAEQLLDTNRQEAIEFFRRGLVLNPYDGLRWQKLGDLLRESDEASSLDAYLHSCFMGDVGSNGCWRAGQLAERLGDVPAAIRYYRQSLYSVALARATELEQEIQLVP